MTGPAGGDRGNAGTQLPHFDGVVQPQGLTTYMYGTYVLTDPSGQTSYALNAAHPGLMDPYVGKRVRVYGTFAPGYPIDDGPPLLVVQRVEGLPGGLP
jgi:hypothetical protein